MAPSFYGIACVYDIAIVFDPSKTEKFISLYRIVLSHSIHRNREIHFLYGAAVAFDQKFIESLSLKKTRQSENAINQLELIDHGAHNSNILSLFYFFSRKERDEKLSHKTFDADVGGYLKIATDVTRDYLKFEIASGYSNHYRL